MSANKIARMQEIANRGLQDKLSPERRAIFDEAARRGLITMPESPALSGERTIQDIADADIAPERKESMLGAQQKALANYERLTGKSIDQETPLTPQQVRDINVAYQQQLEAPSEPEKQEPLTALQTAKGVAGLGRQMLVGAFAEPVAGLAGLAGAALPGEEGQGAEWVEGVQRTLMPTPSEEAQRVGQAVAEYIPEPGAALGESVMEATGKPRLAAIAHTLPTALMEVVGLKAPRLAAKIAKRAETLSLREADQLSKIIEEFKRAEPSQERVADVADTLTSKPKEADIQELAQFDEGVMRAADDLGFSEVPPSVAAANAQFRDVAQGLASMPGSSAKAQYGQFIERMANRADDIIIEGGGDIDKAALSQRFRTETENIMDELGSAEAQLYREIQDKISQPTPVQPENLRTFIRGKVEDAGGVNKLSKPQRDIFNMLYKKGTKKGVDESSGIPVPRQVADYIDGSTNYVAREPTYGAFNQKRKDIGAAIGRKSSPYSDAELGALKELYGPMKIDQSDIAKQFEVDDLQAAADALTIKRKTLENTTVDILGRKLNKDLMPEIATKIAGLPKGNVTKFTEMIDSIPESIRQETVVSALNDLMKGSGADQKSLAPARFVGLMNELNRSPASKEALYQYLPKRTQKSLDNFHKLSDAVYKANKQNITTGKIATFFPENQSFLKRLIGQGASVAATSTAGFVGREATNAVADFLSNNTPSAQKANQFIASKQFQELMKNAVRDGVHEGGVITEKTKKLEKAIQKSERFKKWKETLSGNQDADLVSFGLTNYLMQADEETKE